MNIFSRSIDGGILLFWRGEKNQALGIHECSTKFTLLFSWLKKNYQHRDIKVCWFLFLHGLPHYDYVLMNLNFDVYPLDPLSPWLPGYDALKLNKQWCGLFGLTQASWHGCACSLFHLYGWWQWIDQMHPARFSPWQENKAGVKPGLLGKYEFQRLWWGNCLCHKNSVCLSLSVYLSVTVLSWHVFPVSLTHSHIHTNIY